MAAGTTPHLSEADREEARELAGLGFSEADIANILAAEAADRPGGASPDSGPVRFTVRSSSSGELYSLEAIRTAGGIRFTCTCQAGTNGLHCKHRVAILLDDTSACVDVDANDLDRLRAMTRGSALLRAVEDAVRADDLAEAAKREQKRARKALARLLLG